MRCDIILIDKVGAGHPVCGDDLIALESSIVINSHCVCATEYLKKPAVSTSPGFPIDVVKQIVLDENSPSTNHFLWVSIIYTHNVDSARRMSKDVIGESYVLRINPWRSPKFSARSDQESKPC